MSTLIIDCGSYSVKFLEGKFQKKNFQIDGIDEVLIDDVRDENDLEITLEEYQQKIIRQYIEQTGFTGKVISQLPNDFLTSRYLDLPVNNKKKADMMIPFQLDEELPFSTAESHFISNYHKTSNGQFSAIVQITEDQVFNSYHSFLQTNHTLPSILTSELGVYQSFVSDRKFGGHICILDIGHKTTKAYFAYNDKIVSNHTSSVAGQTIDEIISQTYEITSEEARIYKHENAFILTEGQIDQVSPDQKEFAILMRQSFSPLVQQVQRWLLGYRIKTGFSIEKIYITGGTSGINNIENFLTEKLEAPVEHLKILSLDSQLEEQEGPSKTLPYLMAQSQKFKTPPLSFLTKSYASGLSNGIKMENTSFTLYREAIIAALIILGLSIETFVFINKDITKHNRSITKLLKSRELKLSNKQIKSYRRKPKKVSKNLSKKERVINSDIKILEKRSDDNALRPLAFLSKKIKKNERISLISYKGDTLNSKAVFLGDSKRDITQLKDLVKTMGLDGLSFKNIDEKKLEVSFSGF